MPSAGVTFMKNIQKMWQHTENKAVTLLLLLKKRWQNIPLKIGLQFEKNFIILLSWMVANPIPWRCIWNWLLQSLGHLKLLFLQNLLPCCWKHSTVFLLYNPCSMYFCSYVFTKTSIGAVALTALYLTMHCCIYTGVLLPVFLYKTGFLQIISQNKFTNPCGKCGGMRPGRSCQPG